MSALFSKMFGLNERTCGKSTLSESRQKLRQQHLQQLKAQQDKQSSKNTNNTITKAVEPESEEDVYSSDSVYDKSKLEKDLKVIREYFAEWIMNITKIKVMPERLCEDLEDGVLLCEVVSKLVPTQHNPHPVITKDYKENYALFNKALNTLGIEKLSYSEVKKNDLISVARCLYSLEKHINKQNKNKIKQEKEQEQEKIKNKKKEMQNENFNTETITKTVTTYDLSDSDSDASSQQNVAAMQQGSSRRSGRYNSVGSESESSVYSGDGIDEEIVVEYKTRKKNKTAFNDRFTPITHVRRVSLSSLSDNDNTQPNAMQLTEGESSEEEYKVEDVSEDEEIIDSPLNSSLTIEENSDFKMENNNSDLIRNNSDLLEESKGESGSRDEVDEEESVELNLTENKNDFDIKEEFQETQQVFGLLDQIFGNKKTDETVEESNEKAETQDVLVKEEAAPPVETPTKATAEAPNSYFSIAQSIQNKYKQLTIANNTTRTPKAENNNTTPPKDSPALTPATAEHNTTAESDFSYDTNLSGESFKVNSIEESLNTSLVSPEMSMLEISPTPSTVQNTIVENTIPEEKATMRQVSEGMKKPTEEQGREMLEDASNDAVNLANQSVAKTLSFESDEKTKVPDKKKKKKKKKEKSHKSKDTTASSKPSSLQQQQLTTPPNKGKKTKTKTIVLETLLGLSVLFTIVLLVVIVLEIFRVIDFSVAVNLGIIEERKSIFNQIVEEMKVFSDDILTYVVRWPKK